MEKDKAIMDINAKLDIIADRMMEIEKKLDILLENQQWRFKVISSPAGASVDENLWREPDDKEGF